MAQFLCTKTIMEKEMVGSTVTLRKEQLVQIFGVQI